MTINDLPKFERPRERLHALGVDSLSVRELIEVILAQGSSKSSVLGLSDSLVTKYRNLEQLHCASIEDLQLIKGLGFAKATQIKAALELGKRMQLEELKQSQHIVFNTLQAYKMAQGYLKHKKKEHLLLFCLDSRARLINEPEIISVGTLDCSLVHPREVFETAIKNHSSRIMLAHNHPSGSSLPSVADLDVTKQLYEAGKIMGIELIDHIVVGLNEYTSIREQCSEIFD